VVTDYDDNGNTTQIGNQLMSYDDADRLTSVVQVDPITSANVIKTEYVYDGLSRKSTSITYSWGHGRNENSNGRLRPFFPKGTSFQNLSQLEVDIAVEKMLYASRKCSVKSS